MALSSPALPPVATLPAGEFWRPAWIELAAWTVLAAILALGLLGRAHRPTIGNDGYQYLSVAENLVRGHGIKTSIIYFDAERAHGTMPAPMTTFAPLYSILTAAVSLAGVPLESAAKGVSILSFTLLPAVFGLAAPLGIHRWTFRTLMLLLVANSSMLATADAVATEAVFTLVVASAVLCFSRALGNAAPARLPWQACGWLLIGISYWVRYAGAFFLAGALAFFALRAVLHRSRRTFLDLMSSILALAAVGASMARNAAITGSWKGGVVKHSSDILPFSPRLLAVALYHVVFGEPKGEVNSAAILFVAGALGLLFLGVVSRRRSCRPGMESGTTCWMICTLLLAYCAGMVYADLRMVISFNTRYFTPLLPLLLLVVAYPLAALESSARRPLVYFACVALMFSGYGLANLRGLMQYAPAAPHDEVRSAFRGSAPGGNLTAWAAANFRPGDVITASDGQATAYALRLPTLCLSDPPFSTEVWDRHRLLSEMQRFGSYYLVLYPGLPADATAVQRTSPFLRELVLGKAQNGLEVAARNDAVIIFRRVLPQ